jgi:transposase
VAFREVGVHEVREVLRHWLGGELGLRPIAERAGVDRKTARRYVDAAVAAGVVRDGGEGQLTDELIGAVIGAVRPERSTGYGQAWEALLAVEDEIRGWIGDELQLTNIHGKLIRRGVMVPYRTLHRFAVERCGFGRRKATVRVADGDPGRECQLDFGRLGMMFDPDTGRRRALHALIFTAVFSRHIFVWLSFTQTLADVIAGCEAAWRFYGGVFRVLIPDNLKPVVANADPINPTFTVGWLDYAQARGFGTDPARVRSPKDKPRVERVVQYVRGNFFAGEQFTGLADAQRRVEAWCRGTAGLRLHGTTAQRPAEHFAATERALLLAVPARPYDVPVFTTPKVAPDRHVEVVRALYSVPGELIGQRVEARADSRLVKIYSRGQLIKTHPRKPPGGRSTDPKDYPVGQAEYALRDVATLKKKAAAAGVSVGV